MAIDRDELVRLWHSDDKIDAIAARLGCRTNDILSGWRKLKIAGALPPGDRPRNRTLENEVSSHDGRPSTVGITDDYDPLLERLRRHHKVITEADDVADLPRATPRRAR